MGCPGNSRVNGLNYLELNSESCLQSLRLLGSFLLTIPAVGGWVEMIRIKAISVQSIKIGLTWTELGNIF